MIITLCGSAKFEAEFKHWNEVLTFAGHAVFSLAVYPSDKSGVKCWYSDIEKVALDDVHKRKIAASEAVVILNVGGYYGESTLSEINFALTHNKPIYWLEPPLITERGVDLLLRTKVQNETHKMEAPRSDKELEDVRAFHQKFGFIDSGRHPTMVTKRKLLERAECLQEELDEFKKAIESQDFAEQADALIDLVYFAKGTAVIMGLPWEELWDDVQRANISKVRGVTKRGHAFDVCKPEGWQKPDGEAILTKNGFNKSLFMIGNEVSEELCTDDEQRVELHNVSSDPSIVHLVRFDVEHS